MMADHRMKKHFNGVELTNVDATTLRSSSNELNINYKLPNNITLTLTKLTVKGEFTTNISSIRCYLTEEQFTGFLNTIITQVNDQKNASYNTIHSHIMAFNCYIKMSKEISIRSLSTLLNKCRQHEISSSVFLCVKTILIKWYSLNYPGISEAIIDFIRQVKLPTPKRPTGSKVKSDNPTEGWYTNTEYDLLVQAIWRAYESGTCDRRKTTILLLSAQFGRRPVQIAQLKIGDLKCENASTGISNKYIEFPGAKDVNSEGFRQSKYEKHPIGDELWELCQHQANDTIAFIESHLEYNLSDSEKLILPLFTMKYPMSFLKKICETQYLYENKTDLLSSNILHVKAARVSKIIHDGPSGQSIISERTNLPLHQNAYRFRYTRARQLARSGVPRGMLQFWLGHETKFSIDSYYDDPAERARKLNEQIAPLLAPLAQAFQGKIRDNEANATRGDDPTSRIEVDGREDLGIGSCGNHGFCSASVPIPCYRCTKFQPWVFGPHHEVLSRLLERQKLEDEVPRPYMGRRLLVPLQLDKDIQAVREVIALCEARKAILKESK